LPGVRGARIAGFVWVVSQWLGTARAALAVHLYFPFSISDIAVRLTSIKLAGFKSFVDPTHFQVPGQLVGVVGPNGCGKSNIIDAVRWVLGESRASELRGESMQDVIFNGSTARKPGSRASVELVFDNADGRAGGQWGQYAEIAVKRVLTRDGTSSYYINNLPARRRDIQDIFLGTGLGPRAYAIIGQGMISRLIEAKPEELRVFLEEAAGVSKYKERRRETENRLHDTRENLTRVEDIVRELGANLEKLEGQAVVATKFKELQADGETKQRLLWLLRKNEAGGEQERQQRAIEQAQIDLEAQTAKLREVEAQLETLRVAHYSASDAMQGAQGALYEANAEVSRLEAEIKFIVESRNRVQAQIAALNAQREQWQSQAQKAQDDLEDAAEQLAVAEEKAALAEDEAAAKHDAMPALEARWRDAQTHLNEERGGIAQTEQALKLEAAHQRNADQQLQQLQQRHERLKSEAGGLDAPDETQLEELRMQLAEHEEILHDAQARLADAQETLPRLDGERRSAQERVQSETAQIHQLDARLAALKQLQENVQTEGKIQPWLEKHELNGLPRLWKKLHVEAGWETALESVLRERLAALEVSNLDWVKAFATDAPPAKLAFYAPPAAGAPVATPPALRPLLSLVRIDDAGLRAVLNDWLGLAFVADDLAQALSLRSQLPEGGSFVVKAGHVVTRVGVQLYAADSEQAGMLARQQEIENLTRQVRAQGLLADEAKTAAIRAEAAHTQASQTLTDVRQQAERATQRVHALQMDVLKLTQAHERYMQRSTQIREELEEITAQIDEQRALRGESEANFERHDAELAELQARFEDNQLAFEALDEELTAARAQSRDLDRAATDARFAARNMANRIDELKRSIQVAHEQSERVAASLEDARAELETINEQTAHTGLQGALEIRAVKEEALHAARLELDDLTAKLRAADETRLTAERALAAAARPHYRTAVEGAGRAPERRAVHRAARSSGRRRGRIAGKADAGHEAVLPARRSHAAEQRHRRARAGQPGRARRAEGGARAQDLPRCADRRPERARSKRWKTRSTRSTRKRATCCRAPSTGQPAFRRTVPELFGGGQAKLMMTGDEILDAGVQVMAQPPGKKNSTIHLLSGGEKALTATALVFAMFQLNPAPFCLLDEVDAPLDDANTERFANLVRACVGTRPSSCSSRTTRSRWKWPSS
jgi:chromosome segregation protein